MLKTVHSGKHCSCYIQGEYLIPGPFGKKMVGGELKLMAPIGSAEKQAATQLEMSTQLRKRAKEKLKGACRKKR
jgi:hypothetical protein